MKAAENGKIEEAVEIFSKAIQIAPSRPSGFNNRAQAFRMLEKDAGNVEARFEYFDPTF